MERGISPEERAESNDINIKVTLDETIKEAYLTLRSLTLYIYGAPILDVSRSHTTTQHSR